MATTDSLGNILIVDDDKNICELLQVNLGSEGYCITVEPVAENVMERDLTCVSLILADAMKQPYSGMDLLYDIKDNPDTEGIPVILFSDIKSEYITVDSIEAGADDYIVKPFSLRVLMARVKAVMRRHAAVPRSSSTISFLSMVADLRRQTITIDGAPVPLTAKEYAVAAMLLKNADNFISRVEIFKSVWAGDSAGSNERIVDTNISRLRKKLGSIAPHLISRTGHGYMLSTNVPS